MNERNFGEILERFINMHEKQSQKTEKLIIKSDEKIDALADLVAKLAQARIETKKDREFDQVRMERIEDNQKEQGTHLSAMSDTMILINERVNGNRQKWVSVGGFVAAVATSVASAIIIIKMV
ncbi:MAG: hypothetical protein GY820_38235 [Gammaproteobacteria bacterium]|nr:hypothetical protein [Gammaproteobacteria bacterium]